MFYLHQFDPAQPDLNYRNRNVVKAMQVRANRHGRRACSRECEHSR